MATQHGSAPLWLFASASILALAAAPAGLRQDPRLAPSVLSTRDLLARAATYVRRFEQSMSTVVIQERYVQVIKPWTLPPTEPDGRHLAWFEDLAAVRPDVIVKQRRQTRSDLLLVQLPDQRWTAFRDTFEVNGRSQRHREDRLRELFLEQSESSRRQLRRINERSAEWNLGGFYREINLPTIGLLVVHPRHQQRFTFEAGAISTRGVTACRVVSFKETSKPTLVRSPRERDVPLRGRLCIDDTGTVWSTWLDLDPRYTMRGIIEVVYGRHERADVLVPERMWEWYTLPEQDRSGLPLFVEAMATYSNLRQFTVVTSEQVKD